MTTIPSNNEPHSPTNWLLPLGMITAVIAFLFWLQSILLVPGGLLASEKLAWYLTRSSGVVGYLLLSASTMWGIVLSSKLAKRAMPPWLTLALHNYLGWSAIGLTAFHALTLLFDSYYTYTLANLFIPFTGPYQPFWVGIGIIGFYVMVLTAVSFYLRSWIGQKNWRRLHYLTFLVYLMGTLHGWMAGTDSTLMGPIYLGSGLLTLFLTLFRILSATSASRPVQRRPPAA